jgi:hypothetical protein
LMNQSFLVGDIDRIPESGNTGLILFTSR